jgi:predicted Fe-S protein YdhL (DUF1289 family)
MSTQQPVTLAAARRRQPGVVAPSPCISVCRLDETIGRCVGCHRTLAEIGAWSRLDDEAKLQVWQAIEQRQSR